jgi:hypothetical protein
VTLIHLLNVTFGQADLGFEECLRLALERATVAAKHNPSARTPAARSLLANVVIPILWGARSNRLSKSKVFARIAGAAADGDSDRAIPLLPAPPMQSVSLLRYFESEETRTAKYIASKFWISHRR